MVPRAAGQWAAGPLSRQLRGGHLDALLPSTLPLTPRPLPPLPSLSLFRPSSLAIEFQTYFPIKLLFF